jgi:simple sugar transport system substrate-binding protein
VSGARLRRGLALVAAAVLAPVLLAGCGGDDELVREPSIVAGGPWPEAGDATGAGVRSDGSAVRIAVVTHGAASSTFWTIVRNGVEAAARNADVQVDYRAPEVYSPAQMAALIDRAVTSRPDGLVVSVPDPEVAAAVARATRERIPTVTINTGGDLRLGALAHVGQADERAGYEAGRRLAAAGVRRTICAHHQPRNRALDERCRGLARAMREKGGRSRRVDVDVDEPTAGRRLAAAAAAFRADGMLGLNAGGTVHALEARRRLDGRLIVGGFDLGPDVLAGLKEGRLAFTVDQQPWLQGYLPVVLLAQRARIGVFPDGHDALATGPHFVTRDDADQVLELSRRMLR